MTIEHAVSSCIGISCGKIIKTDTDAFGDAVNVAHKLGEDTAGPGDILLSDEAFAELQKLQHSTHGFQPREETVTGGISLGFHRLVY